MTNLFVKEKSLLIATLIVSAALSGCSTIHAGANHRPIIDGPMNAAYEQDLTRCQEVAKQRNYGNGENQSDAMVGGAVGALSGLGGDGGSIVGGALVGAAIGGGVSALDTRTERKNIVINCMASRGYKVMESQGQHN